MRKERNGNYHILFNVFKRIEDHTLGQIRAALPLRRPLELAKTNEHSLLNEFNRLTLKSGLTLGDLADNNPLLQIRNLLYDIQSPCIEGSIADEIFLENIDDYEAFPRSKKFYCVATIHKMIYADVEALNLNDAYSIFEKNYLKQYEKFDMEIDYDINVITYENEDV